MKRVEEDPSYQEFQFDRVFDENASQELIYKSSVKEIIDNLY